MSVIPEIYVSRMLEKTVIDPRGRKIGRVVEVYADMSGDSPIVMGLGVAYPKLGTRLIPWDSVRIMVREYFNVSEVRDSYADSQPPTDCLRLKKDLLDKQIVDLNGLKVVRVNDLKLMEIHGHLSLVAVDIGFRGLLRRMGMARMVHAWERRSTREVTGALLNWSDIEVIHGQEEGGGKLQLGVTSERLRRLHPADLADIVEELNSVERAAVMSSLDPESAADVLQEMEPDVQTQILEDLPEETAADILEALPADEAADMLGELSEDRAEQLLSNLDEEDANEVRELMDYDEETAGAIMSTDFLSFSKDLTVNDTIERLRTLQPGDGMAYYLYVVDSEGRLEGVVSLRNIIVSPPETRLDGIMDPNVITVKDSDDEQVLADTLDKYGLMALPVTDEDNVLVGVALLQDVVSEIYIPNQRKGLLFHS